MNRGIKKRALCPGCRFEVALNNDGTFRRHGVGPGGCCLFSRQAAYPRPATDTTNQAR